MQEREHERKHRERRGDDVDVTTPGRASTSAQLQRKAAAMPSALVSRNADDNGVHDGAETAVATAAGSSGASLPAPLQRKFESSLGADLSQVRVHTGAESQTAAAAVGAHAYTVGQDIHFGAGKYDPSSAGGEHLLAHEVAHTVQQQGGTSTRQNKLEVSAPADHHEGEADRAADAMVAGRAASVTSLGGGTVSRWTPFTGYSKDDDLKKMPKPPTYVPADGSFTAMTAAVQASANGAATEVASPATSFRDSTQNLLGARDHAESLVIYAGTHQSSKWNPFGNHNDLVEKNAKSDAAWATRMLGNQRVASSATGSWVALLNRSNATFSALLKQAQSMSIQITNVHANKLAGMGDGKEHAEVGAHEIDRAEVGGVGMGMGSAARETGLKAPDTNAYRQAMQEYNEARNELAPQEHEIITTLIPTNVEAIKKKLETATEEKEKWETIKDATARFEQGLSIAFGGAELVAGEVGALKTTEEGVSQPAPIDVKGTGTKIPGMFTKVIDVRLKAIQGHIDKYNVNLKTYTDEAEAFRIKAAVGRYQNGLVKLRIRGKRVEEERDRMEVAFKEYGKSLDAAMVKQGKAAKGSTANADAAALMIAIRDATVATQGAVDGLSSGGVADLDALYGRLAKDAMDRGNDQAPATGGGRADGVSPVFGIEAGRWSGANRAITSIKEMLAARQAQVTGLEAEFAGQFAGSTHGTDSIK